MLTWLTKKRQPARTAQKIYGSIVTQARSPGFYADLGVPDTLEGRFEVLVLHMFLVLEPIRDGLADKALAQGLVDAFFADMDVTHRELGVGDLAVPKKMRRVAKVFHERLEAYTAAVEEPGSVALTDLLTAHLTAQGGAQLCRYVTDARGQLAGLGREALVEGAIRFPALEPGEA